MGFRFSLQLLVMYVFLINSAIMTDCISTTTTTNVASPLCNGGDSVQECTIAEEEEEELEVLMDSVLSSSLNTINFHPLTAQTKNPGFPSIDCGRYNPINSCLPKLNRAPKPEKCVGIYNLNRVCYP